MPIILGVYAGAVAALAGGRPSAIYKEAVCGPVAITVTGLAGDVQANRRLHGGPAQALHHFPAEHYAALAERFPPLAAVLVGGSIGENIASRGMTEATVCIGDVYALGRARVQLTRPRRPCGNIDRRYGQDGMAAHLQQHGICGWYYQVLEPGQVEAGECIELLERRVDAPSLELFRATVQAARPPRELLERFAALEVLGAEWLDKLRGRLKWLRQHVSNQ